MSHGLSSNVACLKRWAQNNPELPMPEDWDTFRRQFPNDAVRMQIADPELVSLLNNSASADRRADALSGSFPDVAPTAQEREESARRARVQEIFDQKPLGGDGQPANISLCLELMKLDPALFARLEAEKKASGPSAEQVETLRAQNEAEADRARHASKLKGMVMAQNAAARRRFR